MHIWRRNFKISEHMSKKSQCSLLQDNQFLRSAFLGSVSQDIIENSNKARYMSQVEIVKSLKLIPTKSMDCGKNSDTKVAARICEFQNCS